ncbi:MAG: DNA polymerase, partial [Aggregatilineales bacterium]
PLDFETVVVDDRAKLAALVEKLNAAEVIVWDVETTSIDQMSAKLVGIALAVDEKTGYYVPVGHQGKDAGTLFADEAGEQLPLDRVIEALHPALTNPDIPKVAHNALYDLVVTQRYGIDVTPIGFDTMIAEWVRDPISRNLGLKRFALAELGITMTEISELLGKGKSSVTMDVVAIEDAAPYAAADAVITLKAMRHLQPQLAEQELDDLFQTLDMPMIPVIAAMQYHGAMLDDAFLRDLGEQLAKQIVVLEQDIYALGESGEFNINSPKQLNEVLFEALKLPGEGLKKTTHGWSTDAVTLDILKDEHEIIPKITEYRELSKLKSTYVDALPELVNPETGRLHTSYNQTGTSTGRFSSSNPNLQNIPIRTEIGREVRRAFIAPPGYKLLAVDYSQIELRILAHISQDATLIAAFNEGQDIHRATAAAVNGIAPEDVTYEQRSFAKRVNFGLIYGMGARRLAQDSDLTYAEAENFVKTYFDRLPGVERYIKGMEEFVKERGYTETLLGRKRTFAQLAAGKSGRR